MYINNIASLVDMSIKTLYENRYAFLILYCDPSSWHFFRAFSLRMHKYLDDEDVDDIIHGLSIGAYNKTREIDTNSKVKVSEQTKAILSDGIGFKKINSIPNMESIVRMLQSRGYNTKFYIYANLVILVNEQVTRASNESDEFESKYQSSSFGPNFLEEAYDMDGWRV